MRPLYHVSEEPGIRLFEPRSRESADEALVWAVDQDHLPNYLLPRECPRVTFCASESTSEEDAERFLLGSNAVRVIAIESGWLDRVARTTLCRYEFTGEGFVLRDAIAGYHVCRSSVPPVGEVAVADLLGELTASGVEIRIMPSLWELRERVIHSTLGFSIIRMRNAAPPERGFAAYRPVTP